MKRNNCNILQPFLLDGHITVYESFKMKKASDEPALWVACATTRTDTNQLYSEVTSQLCRTHRCMFRDPGKGKGVFGQVNLLCLPTTGTRWKRRVQYKRLKLKYHNCSSLAPAARPRTAKLATWPKPMDPDVGRTGREQERMRTCTWWIFRIPLV